MKKLILSVAMLAFFFTSSQAQFNIEKLFGGANIAYAKPIGDFSDVAKGGLSYNILGGYQLTDNLGVGLEYGRALTVGIEKDSAGVDISSGIFGAQIFGLQSIQAKGWYRFTTGTVRPYVAAGVGAAQVAEPDATDADGNVTLAGAKRWGLGASVELGVNINGFNLSYSFNVNGKGPEEPVFNADVKDLSVNYHRFAAGYIYNF